MSTWFDHTAHVASEVMGSKRAFLITWGFVLGCLALGPFVGWMLAQMLLTTALTVVTQLTAMLITHSQSRSEQAMQRKLDELIRAIEGADNRLRGIEQEET